MVDAAVAILLEQVESSGVQRRAAVLPCRLVVRGSARRPAPRIEDLAGMLPGADPEGYRDRKDRV
jgi:hypothetical protein